MTLWNRIESSIVIVLLCFGGFIMVLVTLIKSWISGKHGIGLTFMGYWFITSLLIGIVVLCAHVGTQIGILLR